MTIPSFGKAILKSSLSFKKKKVFETEPGHVAVTGLEVAVIHQTALELTELLLSLLPECWN